MDDSRDRLAEDLASAAFQHGAEQGFWDFVERDEEDRVFVCAHAPDERKFMICLDCNHYATEPIGGLFVDPSDRQVKPNAWPDGNQTFEQWVKFRSGTEKFICWDQDRYGIQRHVDWRGLRKWEKEENKIVAYMNFIRQILWLPGRGYNRRQN